MLASNNLVVEYLSLLVWLISQSIYHSYYSKLTRCHYKHLLLVVYTISKTILAIKLMFNKDTAKARDSQGATTVIIYYRC